MSRVLFIDAYDSFSNNIINLLRDQLLVSVQLIKVDDPRFVFNDDAFHHFLDHFDAVVAGPGPGHPANPNDVGLIGKLWHLPEHHLLPVLGICLGFQSLALAFGASVERLCEPRHGMVTPVTHCGRDIFEATGDVIATQYHSLHVCLRDSEPHMRESDPILWTPRPKCPDLLPLAWDLSDSVRNGPILSGMRHAVKPFWGVQYHPESICTDENGQNMIELWWQHASYWNHTRFGSCVSSSTTSLDSAPMTPLEVAGYVPDRKVLSQKLLRSSEQANPPTPTQKVHWKALDICDGMETVDVVNAVRLDRKYEPILLESGVRDGQPLNSETGRFSIIGLHDQSSTQIRYSTGEKLLTAAKNGKAIVSKTCSMSSVFEYTDNFVRQNRAADGLPDVPFWGGLIGFISYEAGLETIDVPPAEHPSTRPDVWFVFADRSVVLDHVSNIAYVQSIREDDEEWLYSIQQKLKIIQIAKMRSSTSLLDQEGLKTTILSEPTDEAYQEKVLTCQSHLRAGSSYELCLTDQTLMKNPTDPWHLYQKLRRANPAPFGAYLNLPDTRQASLSLVGSSPERFLSWSRDAVCQFRPIKGTVRKGPEMTRAKAEAILNSNKERAENLMIVDLIRHDLNGVPGIQDVRVPKLMIVEEYETVYQLVSVIEGQVIGSSRSLGSPSPLAALTRSLPPGSMTGAPKKRSCELLKEVEGQQPRGVYSGVLGYLDVGGGGDFSVVIRTAFKWADEDMWRIGAGGAVTALSEPEAEWEEMLTKRERLLDALM